MVTKAEDERLHDVIAVGRHVVADLARRAAAGPTVRLASAYFEDARSATSGRA